MDRQAHHKIRTKCTQARWQGILCRSRDGVLREMQQRTHDKSRSNPLDDPCTLSSRKSLNTTNRTMIYQRNLFRQVRIRQDPRRLMKMKAQPSPSTECEGRHHHPLKKRDKSSRSRRSPSHSCSMQPMEISSSASWSTGSNLGNPSQTRGELTSTWHASMTSSLTTMSQKPH